MPLTKDMNELSDLHRQKSKECIWEWILRVQNNGGMKITLYQAEFVDVDMLD